MKTDKETIIKELKKLKHRLSIAYRPHHNHARVFTSYWKLLHSIQERS